VEYACAAGRAVPEPTRDAAMTSVTPDEGSEHPNSAPEGALRLENEFASVWVAIDRSANGARLCITDAATGQTLLLDPLQVEALAWARLEDLRFLMAPSYRERVIRELLDD
jgi:hypothetical protein